MIDVYVYRDPSCLKKHRVKVGEVTTKKEKKVFLNGYVKGLYDGALRRNHG